MDAEETKEKESSPITNPEKKEEEKSNLEKVVVDGQVQVEETERFGQVLVQRNLQGQALQIDNALTQEEIKNILEKQASFTKEDQSSEDLIKKKISQAHPETTLSDSAVFDEDQEDLDFSSAKDLLQQDLFEFGDLKRMPFYQRWFYNAEKDVFNWYGSFMSLAKHGWGFESLLTVLLGVGSTCFFIYYRTPEDQALAARLDFNIIGSAVVFPVTFLIAETFRRREGAIQRLASIKALLCQIEIAMLTWRWKGAKDMGDEWENRVHETLHRIINTMTLILTLPTWNTNRHIYTQQGRNFKQKVIKRERELTRRLGLLFSELHWFVEDLKEVGLPANEASRINQYHSLLQIDFEALAMVKSYRTPNGKFKNQIEPKTDNHSVSRSFVRVMVLIMPIFYGPYFAWVSGTIGAGGQTNAAFAICLTVVTIFVLLGLVRVQRSMEDPFTSHFPGDVIDMKSEQLDTESRLNLIVSCARQKKRAATIQQE